MLLHNICSTEGIAPPALFTNPAEPNGDPVPINLFPSTIAIKKEAPGDVQLMECFVKSPSYGVESAAYHRLRRSIG